MGKKVRTTLTIDREVMRKAKEIGLNVSQYCENCLKDAIERLERPKSGNTSNNPVSKKQEWTGRDLNPRPPECKAFWASNGEIDVNWDDFKRWTRNRYSKSHARTIYAYAWRHQRLLFGNLAELEGFGKAKRRNVLAALTGLSRFLGIYEEFNRRRKSYGFKWETQSSFESFLRIMRNDSRDAVEWVKKCRKHFDRRARANDEFIAFESLIGKTDLPDQGIYRTPHSFLRL